MTAHTHDDAFHEIQLNGKQLVFLVMLVTIVGVSIFLLGVLVGRNVRAQRAVLADAGSTLQMPAAEILPPPSAPVVPPQADADPRAAAPPPTADDESAAAAEVLKPAAPRPAVLTTDARVAAAPPAGTRGTERAEKPAEKPAEKVAAKAAPPAARPTAAAPVSAPAAAEVDAPAAPAGNGFAVQVAALNARPEADAIARRLTAKGYAAYVQVPTTGSVYRVRVGTFKTRREAETVAARLQKEEQFKPWVTR